MRCLEYHRSNRHHEPVHTPGGNKGQRSLELQCLGSERDRTEQQQHNRGVSATHGEEKTEAHEEVITLSQRERECVCVCVCVCARALPQCVCVCVCTRPLCVCVCVCEWQGSGEAITFTLGYPQCACVYVCEWRGSELGPR